MTPTEQWIARDRINFYETCISVFVVDYLEEVKADEELILLAQKSNSFLSKLKDKLSKQQ